MSTYAGNKPNFLSQLVQHSKLTPDGRDWLTLALDPFHDLSHQAAGYPDSDGSQTVVSCYQYQADVAAPLGNGTNNWDAHIFTLPFSNGGHYTFATQDNATWTTAKELPAAPVTPLGILNIVRAVQGDPLIPVAGVVPTNQVLPGVDALETASGVTRIIGIGFEVTNTTAEMHKQGAVTVYRLPQNSSPPGTVLMVDNSGIAYQGAVQHTRIKMPPSTVAQANLLKGTRTWDASAGVYATCVQNSVSNPMMHLGNQAILLSDQSEPSTEAATVLITGYTAFAQNPPSSDHIMIPDLTQLTPHDTTGAMFTGLSAATTLTVKLKVYVERAPAFTDPNICVLATPSAGYDVTALELYSHAISQLPVAVTVSENGLGDWFKGVVNVIKDVAGGAGALLGTVVPGANQLGNAVQGVLGGVDRLLGASSRRAPAPSVMSLVQPMRALTVRPQPRPRQPQQPRAKRTLVRVVEQVRARLGRRKPATSRRAK